MPITGFSEASTGLSGWSRFQHNTYGHIATDAQADGSLMIRLEYSRSARPASVRFEVLDRENGEVIAMREERTWENKPGDVFEFKVEGIKPWSAESPTLYALRTSLLDHTGAVLHRVTETIGFRTVEVRPQDGIYVNGTRVILKGTNRHSFWPYTGRAMSPEMSRSDILIMKEMNMNAVRMSHYPPDKHFLEMTDELGMYVIDELAGWQGAYDTEVGGKLVREMVRRDVNHPSVIIWANGNEGGWNTDLDDDFALHDPQNRPVIHPWANFGGIQYEPL